MSVRLLRWQGPERAERCRQHLQSVIGAWHSEWSAAPFDPMLVGTEPTANIGTSMEWWCANAGQGRVLLALPAGVLSLCGRHLLALGDAAHNPLIESVANDALRDLLDRLAKKGQEDCVVEKLTHAPSEQETTDRHGSLGFVLSQPLARVLIIVDAAWCDSFAPLMGKPSLLPLAAREGALAQTYMPLKATVDLGILSVQESMGWAVGEILVTDARSDARVQLTSGGRHLAAGALFHQADRRAVRVLAAPIKSNSHHVGERHDGGSKTKNS